MHIEATVTLPVTMSYNGIQLSTSDKVFDSIVRLTGVRMTADMTAVATGSLVVANVEVGVVEASFTFLEKGGSSLTEQAYRALLSVPTLSDATLVA